MADNERKYSELELKMFETIQGLTMTDTFLITGDVAAASQRVHGKKDFRPPRWKRAYRKARRAVNDALDELRKAMNHDPR